MKTFLEHLDVIDEAKKLDYKKKVTSADMKKAGNKLGQYAHKHDIDVKKMSKKQMADAMDMVARGMKPSDALSYFGIDEATYQGKEVPLNKPMKGDVKKSKVFVKDPKTGNVKKVNFGDKSMSIKKDQPGRKKSYCARSAGIEGGGKDKTKANYWSRKAWDC